MTRRITLITLYFFCALFVFEVLGHRYFSDRLRSDLWVRLGTHGLKHTPNFIGQFKNFEMSYNVHTNRDGFRDTITADSLIPSDWIVLGDSLTFGVGAEFEELWHQLIEKESGIQIYNAGLGGAQPKHYINNYSENFGNSKHSGVLIGFHLATDFISKGASEKISGDPNGDFYYYRWRLLVFMGRTSITYNVIRDLIYSLIGGRNSNDGNQKIQTSVPLEDILFVCDLFANFSLDLQSKNRQLIVAFLPEKKLILSENRETFAIGSAAKQLGRCLRKRNTVVLDPTDYLSSYPPNKKAKLFFPIDGHLSAYGNSEYAKFLQRSNLFPN